MKKEITAYVKPDKDFIHNHIVSCYVDEDRAVGHFVITPSEEDIPLLQALVYGITTGGGVNFDIADAVNKQRIVQVTEVRVNAEGASFISFAYDKHEYNKFKHDMREGVVPIKKKKGLTL